MYLFVPSYTKLDLHVLNSFGKYHCCGYFRPFLKSWDLMNLQENFHGILLGTLEY